MVLSTVVLTLIGGCATKKGSNANVDTGELPPTADAPKSGRGKNFVPPTTVDTAESPFGRVVSANLPLQFVVLDFSLRPLPSIDQRMSLYRKGQKVGEVKISGPILNGNVVADIVAGDAQIGDEVRGE